MHGDRPCSGRQRRYRRIEGRLKRPLDRQGREAGQRRIAGKAHPNSGLVPAQAQAGHWAVTPREAVPPSEAVPRCEAGRHSSDGIAGRRGPLVWRLASGWSVPARGMRREARRRARPPGRPA